jgi:hypothetical protein
MSDRAVDVPWTLAGTSYVVTATEEAIVFVRLAVATVPTAQAKQEFFADLDGDAEEAFFAAVDAELAKRSDP